MAGEAGTLDLLARELALVLAPLEQRLASGQAVALVAELGLDLPDGVVAAADAIALTAVRAGELPPMVVRLTDAIDAGDAARIVNEGAALLGKIRDVLTAIDRMAEALDAAVAGVGGLTPEQRARLQAELQAFPGRLLEFLIVEYLQVKSSGALSALTLFGIVEKAPAAVDLTDPTAVPHDRRAVRLDRLVDLFVEPPSLREEVTARLDAADAALSTYDGSAGGPARVDAATAAIRAMLGEDAVATAEFTVPVAVGVEWHNAVVNSEAGRLTSHLHRDFPVDDWLHGLARVREKLRLWERVTLLAGAVGRSEPQLLPVQLPFHPADPWLGLEIPADHRIDGDRLLYTAHYAQPLQVGGEKCGLLLDEWTEVIPGRGETTGIAFHYDRPGAEPPQAMLLVTPPRRTGAWSFEDLVAAVNETLDLACTRAVEPAHIDATAYAQLLPATVSSATRHPITISTDLSRNNLPGGENA